MVLDTRSIKRLFKLTGMMKSAAASVKCAPPMKNPDIEGDDSVVHSKPTGRTDSGMEHFGYKESLARSIGAFGSFAAGVSYISILTGTFQLFYVGFGTAGPAYLWSWPMVLVGQLAVALCFMELSAKYPIAGSVYN